MGLIENRKAQKKLEKARLSKEDKVVFKKIKEDYLLKLFISLLCLGLFSICLIQLTLALYGNLEFLFIIPKQKKDFRHCLKSL